MPKHFYISEKEREQEKFSLKFATCPVCEGVGNPTADMGVQINPPLYGGDIMDVYYYGSCCNHFSIIYHHDGLSG